MLRAHPSLVLSSNARQLAGGGWPEGEREGKGDADGHGDGDEGDDGDDGDDHHHHTSDDDGDAASLDPPQGPHRVTAAGAAGARGAGAAGSPGARYQTQPGRRRLHVPRARPARPAPYEALNEALRSLLVPCAPGRRLAPTHPDPDPDSDPHLVYAVCFAALAPI